MNQTDITRFLIDVAAFAPQLTGGPAEVQRHRAENLGDYLGDAVTLDHARHALRSIIRTGVTPDALNWSRIVAETLAVMRRRTLTGGATDHTDAPPPFRRTCRTCQLPRTNTRHNPGTAYQHTFQPQDDKHHDDDLIPMPADFNERVTYWRDKARIRP